MSSEPELFDGVTVPTSGERGTGELRGQPSALSRRLVGRLRKSLGAAGLVDGDAVVLACSGGPDSVALLELTVELCRKGGPLLRPVAIHVDHRLRPGSETDADLVAEHAARLGIPFVREVADVAAHRARSSPSEAARLARYASLEQARVRLGARFVLLAHSRSDQAETVLLRLLRGTGLEGLAAMAPSRDALLRPLLSTGRAELLALVAERGLKVLDDPANADPRYPRSRIRHELLPLLHSLTPAIEALLARLACNAADEVELRDLLLEPLVEKHITDDPLTGPSPALRVDLAGLDEVLALALLRRAITRLQGDSRGLTRRHLEEIYAVRSGGRVSLPGGLVAEASPGKAGQSGLLRLFGPLRPGQPPAADPATDRVSVASEPRREVPDPSAG